MHPPAGMHHRSRRGWRGQAAALATLAALALAALAAGPGTAAAQDYAAERAGMLRAIAASAAGAGTISGVAEIAPEVMAVLGRVPRHLYVPTGRRDAAYENRPLPIGHGQTISQPYIVALMTDLLRPRPGQRVLEIGTGSGYQAAVLAGLVARVYSIEIIEPLGRTAQQALAGNGVANVELRVGDGYYGWPEAAPFDGILVTAAAGHIPPPLVRQLKPGGRMVIPVGAQFMTQQLVLVEKGPDGSITTRQILPVQFVPLTGKH